MRLKFVVWQTLTLNPIILTLTTLKKQAFENIAGKRENADNQHFLLFLQCFLPFPKRTPVFNFHLFCRLQMLLTWTNLKICCLANSLPHNPDF